MDTFTPYGVLMAPLDDGPLYWPTKMGKRVERVVVSDSLWGDGMAMGWPRVGFSSAHQWCVRIYTWLIVRALNHRMAISLV